MDNTEPVAGGQRKVRHTGRRGVCDVHGAHEVRGGRVLVRAAQGTLSCTTNIIQVCHREQLFLQTVNTLTRAPRPALHRRQHHRPSRPSIFIPTPLLHLPFPVLSPPSPLPYVPFQQRRQRHNAAPAYEPADGVSRSGRPNVPRQSPGVSLGCGGCDAPPRYLSLSIRILRVR